jgi:hypothetical protein
MLSSIMQGLLGWRRSLGSIGFSKRLHCAESGTDFSACFAMMEAVRSR